MARPPLISAEKKTLIVVSILRGEVTMAEAARREGVSQTSIAKWRDRFLAGGQTRLAAGNHQGTSSRETQLTSEVEELTSALGEIDVDDSRDGTVWIVRVRWEDLNGDYLGYSNGEVGTAAGGLPSSFTQKGGTVTAPTGAVYGRAEAYFYLASGWLNVDDITVTPTTTTNVTETLYYGFGGDTVGMRVDGELSWIFGDQFGSTGITYQADGPSTVRHL